MKTLGILLISLLILAVLPVVVAACGEQASDHEVCGIYRQKDNPQDYLLINNDGSCLKRESGIGIDGEWEAHNGVIIFIWRGIQTEGEITGNSLMDANGNVWVKENPL